MNEPAPSVLHDYWDAFYASRASADVPEEPSAFARWVRGRLQPADRVLEFGFGTGRDSLWFARQGHPVTGYDFAESAVDAATARAEREGLGASFAMLDLYDRAAVRALGASLSSTDGRAAVYGRFLIHSLEEAGRANFLDLSSVALGGGGNLFLEFRTGKDEGARHLFGDDHFRVYLDPEVVVGEIESRGGRVVTLEQGHGLAVYRSEDPHVARVVASWT